MNKNYGKLKSIMLSMLLAVGMLLPASSFAQSVEAETGGGLLGFGKLFGTDDLFDNLIEEEPTEAWMLESGGLFNSYESDNADNTFSGNSGLFNIRGNATITVGIQNDSFGEEAPLGSGLVILLGVGLGYVALKKKEDKR